MSEHWVEWRPSNATEGDMWMWEWCTTCLHGDGIDDPDVVDVCEVYVSLLGGYHEEVIEGPIRGTCLRWQRKDRPVSDTRQINRQINLADILREK